VHVGVPQWSVLSLALFNYFVSNFPAPSQVLEALNADMVNIAAWAARKKMSISAEKSQVTFFTPHTKEFNIKPKIYYQGSLVPVTNTIKILGLTLDTSHTGTQHEKIQANRASGWHCSFLPTPGLM
jgi:hypothetical protein